MASVLKVDKLDPQSGTALEIGTSGDTITVPSGVTLDINSGATLDATGATVTGAIGKVLQVVRASTTTATTTSSTSMVDITNLTVDITPSATSSKIYVIMHVAGIASNSTSTSAVTLQIYRASGFGTSINMGYESTDQLGMNATLTALDSPSSTSVLTYKGQMKNREANNVSVNVSNDTSSITVMEIAG